MTLADEDPGVLFLRLVDDLACPVIKTADAVSLTSLYQECAELYWQKRASRRSARRPA